jgi:phosphate-selective porin OprO/OprP
MGRILIFKIPLLLALCTALFPARAGTTNVDPQSLPIVQAAPVDPVTPATNSPTPATIPEEGIKGLERSPQDNFQLHLRTNAAPEATLSTNVLAAPEKSFRWDVTWEGWDGLRIGLSQKTPLKLTPREMLGLAPLSNAPSLHLEQLKLTTRLGGLLEVDAAAYKTDGNLDLPNDIALRRARLRAQGDCILLLPFSYKVELGYIPHQFNLNEAWLASERLDYVGYIVAGVYQPPMGLDLVTSSRDLTFMEPATVLQALAPANEAGIQIGHPVFDDRATWALGIFGGGIFATEYGNASQDYGNLIGRFTWLAMDHLAPADRPGENGLLHLGLSANVQYSASSAVRYQSRPESYLAQQLIDTGNIDASGSGAVGAEAAYVNGPFSLQGEFLDSLVRENDGPNLNFYGFYANASWYLTGESRPYDRLNGKFKRLVPLRNFDFGRGGAWGAFEIAARFSYTDLDDGDVHGGKIGLMMGELNWYLHSHVRWMFNAGGGHVSGGVHDGNILLFQTRVGVDF